MKLIMISIFVLGAMMAPAQTIRDFSLTDTQNETYTFSQLKGEHLTIIDFWASWCKPCLKAMPVMEEMYLKNKNSGVNIIGINCDGPRSVSKVAPLVNALGISYSILLDVNNDLMKDLEVTSLPTLLIIDNEKKVVYRHEGFAKGDEFKIQEEIEILLTK